MSQGTGFDAIVLPEPAPWSAPGANEAPTRAVQGGDCAQVNEGALLSFNGSVREQSLEDITNSLLFAQLAADYQFDRKEAPADWSKIFLNTLSVVGWTTQSIANETKASTGPIDWTGLITSKMPSDVVELVKDSISACDRLPQDGKAMSIWNDAISGPTGGLFLIGSAIDANGSPSLSLASSIFQYEVESPGFLAWDLYYSIKMSWSNMELNEDIYGKIRQTIINKLGDRPKYLIASVPMQR